MLKRRYKRKAPLAAPLDIENRRMLFIGGLHRSGTSILHRLLREHPGTSGFANTGAPQDEGQHLQTVFPSARVHGGPGRFAFDPRSHLTETSAAATPAGRDRLLREWGAYYDPSKAVLLEKSPPNLIRSRYFQALFPEARFVFVVRHPIAVALATQKWARTSVIELILHWHVAHSLMLGDLGAVRNYALMRYEDLVASPKAHLDRICELVGLAPFTPEEGVVDHNAGYFARWRQEHGEEAELLDNLLAHDQGVMATFGYSLSEPFVGPYPR